MAQCLVVYASRYGSTQEVARAVADGLGADLAEAGSLPDLGPYGVVILGSPIYSGEYLPSLLQFIRANKAALQQRRIAAFITAAADMEVAPGLTGDEDDAVHTQHDYARGLAELAGGQFLASRGFGGRLKPEQLSARDFETLSWFYRFLMRAELRGFDLLDLPAARRWGEQLRQSVQG